MSKWVPIKYMGFWDVPLNFIARYQGETFFFDCPFRQDLDDYAESFTVYLMPDLQDAELPKDWTTLHRLAIRRLAEIPVNRVQFDPSKRQAIDQSILEEITARKAAECVLDGP